MSTSYYVDLGFDIQSAPLSNYNENVEFTASGQTLYPLQVGLVNHSNGGSPAWFTHFIYDSKTQDKLRFRLFDISAGIDPSTPSASGWTPTSFAFYTYDPASGAAIQPFSYAVLGTSLPSYQSGTLFNASQLSLASSPVASPIYGTLPCWYLAASAQDLQGQYFRFTQDGEFELSLSVIVQSPDGATTKYFMADPRMYVGPNSWP